MNQFTVSLWGDESFAAVLASKPIDKIVTIVARDTSPPLYYLCLHLFMKVFGSSETSIRSLSFIFFLFSCFFVFLIGQKLWDKKTGILASLACFFNPFLFHYAFEGRMYAILLLTTTAAAYFYLAKNQVAYVLAAIAALYSHHFSIFVIAAHFFFQIPLLFKKGFLKTLKPYLIITLLYTPWLYPLYYQTSLVGSGFWLARPTFESIKSLFDSFFLAQSKALSRKLLIIGYLGAFLSRRWGKGKKEIFLASLALIPIGLTFIISQFFSSIFYDRYLLYTIPPILLLLVSQRRKVSSIFLLLYFVVLIPLCWHYFTHPTKRPFRRLADFVKENQTLEYGLVNYPGRAHHLFESKYYGLTAPLYVPEENLPFFVGTALMEEKDVIKTLPEKEKIMLITSNKPNEVNLSGYYFVKEKQFGDLYLLWFDKEK